MQFNEDGSFDYAGIRWEKLKFNTECRYPDQWIAVIGDNDSMLTVAERSDRYYAARGRAFSSLETACDWAIRSSYDARCENCKYYMDAESECFIFIGGPGVVVDEDHFCMGWRLRK